ncbi:Uncharacterised protein [Mycobacteroides abscessus subsp. bolletii]|uniref:hypothetical protein n=1 Tax=Mycobacteroides abscessus TaxID=36809 RepID=UPI00092B71B2|nr:hypothetical protein [Mycobacteroides abscessus]SIJ03606.1 Uncharacterised protein [Mycobacteroides abscessus subsp. bolletii]SLD76898.1 Uncharacterised protein [Mycobacteroides abscessus subsp. bolletii]SLD84109.1 Uncharacterised protein [Mycobacteroides abscessus subsp. bolletii]
MYSPAVQPVVLRKCGACEDVILDEQNTKHRAKDLTDHFVILGLGHGYVFRKYLCRECYSKVCDCLGLDREYPWMKNAEFVGEIEESFDDEDLEDLEEHENERD